MAAAAVTAGSYQPGRPADLDGDEEAAPFQAGQRVRTVAGELGRVIGFYRRSNTTTAVVVLDGGVVNERSLRDLTIAP